MTNDIRDLWRESTDSLEAFRDNDDAAAIRLRELLARHKLIAAADVRNLASTSTRKRSDNGKGERKKRKVKASAASAFNMHLKGGVLEAALAGTDD